MEDIGDYMSSTVLSVDSEATVQEAVHYMHANNVGSVLIKEAGAAVRYGGGRNTRYLLPAVGLGFSIAMTFLQRLTPRQP